MRKKLLSFNSIVFFLFSFLILITACQREISNETGGGGTPTPGVGVDDNIMVTAGARGIVIDENNLPVQGATVTSGAYTTTTDRYGVFGFSNISLSKANGYIKVVKAGYFTGAKTFVTTAGRIHNVRIQLIPKTNTGSFDAATGGTVTLTSGGKLVMPASAVTDAGGTAYSGMVNVAMTWIDPTAPNLPEIVPGDLRGITTGGEERGLETYGMLGVELTTMGGQPLKVAAGKKAELTFPIPAALGAAAPAIIDLWHFDEAKGRWIQEGTATKNGSNYVAQVSHFSFWNCDAPFPLIDLCMTVVNATNNLPLVNVQVRIKRTNGSYGYGYTDSLGNLCGKVPKNEPLVLEIMGQCNNIVYSQNIGPFSANTSLGTISVTIPPTNQLVITGTVVNCSNANVTNGVAVIYTGGTYSYSVPVTNGTFTHTIIRCTNAALSFSVIGIDYATNQQSGVVGGTGTTGTVNVGTIQACGTSSLQFVEFLIDGSPVNYTQPPDNIVAADSSSTGTYSNKTNVYAFRQSGGVPPTTSYSGFNFSNNTAPATGLPLNSAFINAGSNQVAQQILTSNPTVDVTAFGPPLTGFIEGNFNIMMNFSGTPKNVICTFRVRRN
ncbi:MAG: carboxypeptidase regulatory-like domain-containing protein [Chitinophagaceae bacterium]|nr:carboxypeptidase regulatory-like domain-containing protein [Chitinophagaceae bacterium]